MLSNAVLELIRVDVLCRSSDPGQNRRAARNNLWSKERIGLQLQRKFLSRFRLFSVKSERFGRGAIGDRKQYRVLIRRVFVGVPLP